MDETTFGAVFKALTDNAPFPWQWALYQRFVSDQPDNIPSACTLPTGLGKTSVIALWLIALAHAPEKIPRRLGYIVNRRTVVDQSTREAEKLGRNLETAELKERLTSLCAVPTDRPLAISTLRGQFADNREWSADPSKPAIIVGTVDMIGSRLLFSGYGIGFKSRPLHAGFLGQDVLLVHDEAHLEPAFQELLVNIQREQHEKERAEKLPWPKLRVMELTATSRGSGTVFTLSDKDRAEPEVRKRIEAKKEIHLHANKDEKKLAEEIADLALKHEESGRTVLVFVRKVDNVEKVVKRLPKDRTRQLTGTLRGLERDQLVEDAIFRHFLPNAEKGEESVYLVCTSAGEVGVNISADHLVCDLSTFDSMAQRLGRVNRFGERDDTRIDIVYPKSFDEKDDYESRLKNSLELLRLSNGNGSPAALGELHEKAMREGAGTGPMSADCTAALHEYILATYAPQPKLLPVSDILFDAWALTTIRGKLPGRPMVEPYLHGISGWEPPETHVAWREEVWELRLKFKSKEERKQREAEERKQVAKFATELLEDYPLKPHELLRDNSARVFDRLKKLKATGETPVWLVSDDDTVEVTTLAELLDAGKEGIERKTVLLPPSAGGLKDGMLTDNPGPADDVADEWFEDAENKVPRRKRFRSNEPKPAVVPGMRLVREIDTKPDAEEEDADNAPDDSVTDENREADRGRYWRWYVRPRSADDDASKTAREPIPWNHHTDDVVCNAMRIADALLREHPDLHEALVLAAKFHDLGKKREVWQKSIGNPNPKNWLAKSGGGMVPREITAYRHEFGSLLDLLNLKGEFRTEFDRLPSDDARELVLHLIATHHGRGRPHFPADEVFDPGHRAEWCQELAREVPRRYGRLQRKYGRWGLAYLESLLRAADAEASANPSLLPRKEVTGA